MLTADEVKTVTHYCVHLRSVWRHCQILFEEGQLRRTLLHRIAPVFFGDLNQILIEQLVLQICKLTDPETTMGRKNLTIDYLVDNGEFSADPAEFPKIKTLRDSIHQFRSTILPARNRLISHMDRDAVMAGVSLGGASEAAWLRFWDDLDELVHLVYSRYVDPGGHFHLNDIGMISDADSVVKALKESTYFHAALRANEITQILADIASNSEFSEA
jgi:AbiU2